MFAAMLPLFAAVPSVTVGGPCPGAVACTLAATFANGNKLTAALASPTELSWAGGSITWARSTASDSCLGNWTDSGGNSVDVSETAITGPGGGGWYPATVTTYRPGRPAPPFSPPPPAPPGSARVCDVYGSHGTPCVAAHSVARALYGAYSGALYEVRRASDNTTNVISVLAAGGVANSTDQDDFCAGTACIISAIMDQSGRGNHLATAPPGGNHRAPDAGVNASRLATTLHGHRIYGAFFEGGMGYRNDCTSGIATGDEPETIYMVTAGQHYNGGCCFDCEYLSPPPFSPGWIPARPFQKPLPPPMAPTHPPTHPPFRTLTLR